MDHFTEFLPSVNMDDIIDSYITEGSGSIKYAGFWIRVVAGIIDTLILLPFSALVIYNIMSIKSLTLAFCLIILLAIYKPVTEFKRGATLGKMAVKIKVVNLNYQPITLIQSIIRFLPWLVGYIINVFTVLAMFRLPNFNEILTYAQYSAAYNKLSTPELYGGLLLLGVCLMLVLDSRKRGGHDILAKTYCIYE